MKGRGRNRNGSLDEVVARERKVWELRINRGWTQYQIADELGIKQTSVSGILKRMTKKYAKANLDDIKAIKEIQLAQYEQYAMELQEAWFKSKQPTITKTQKKKEASTAKGKGLTEGIYKEENKHGDPRYLELWRKLKEDVRKMTGIDMIDDIESEAPIGKIEIEIVDAESIKAKASVKND
jgi:transcriptional regulator with XRE-family HTH domain